jgi:formylglycine-generating enzyme required for sulfatase activity
MQPDNPVENITWYSAIVFANRLSEKHGLKPTYDLSEIKWVQGTSAENGTLQVESGEIKINAINGDYYLAEGYRLPTEAEQEYLLRAMGAANGKYYFGDSEVELKDHAWYGDNSDKQTHPVGQLRPLIINGKEFYDLLGNVGEWGWDGYAEDLNGGDDPIGSKSGSHRIVRGGDWVSTGDVRLCSAHRSACMAGFGSYAVGFRLVRTIHGTSAQVPTRESH